MPLIADETGWREGKLLRRRDGPYRQPGPRRLGQVTRVTFLDRRSSPGPARPLAGDRTHARTLRAPPTCYQAPSLEQDDHLASGLQFGLQFIAVRPSSPRYAHGI